MANKSTDIIARYGNWYKGADDFFTHCLILRSGECRLLGQGLNVVTLTKFNAPASKLEKLKDEIALIPDAWADSSYDNVGFNFITGAETPSASEVAVLGKKAGGILGYFVPPAGSEAETLVKAIAKID
jgi:hypothetical protein